MSLVVVELVILVVVILVVMLTKDGHSGMVMILLIQIEALMLGEKLISLYSGGIKEMILLILITLTNQIITGEQVL